MKKSFYSDGLKFSCKRCSSCCRHTPGYVFLSYNDLQNLIIATALNKEEFVQKYCRIVNINGFQRVSLIEKENYDCIFWESGKGCVIYAHRPIQCKSYPFWSINIDTHNSWNSLSGSCPGINTGKINTKTEIDTWLRKNILEGYIKVIDGKIIY